MNKKFPFGKPYLTAKEKKCFGADGRLKIIEQWVFNGDTHTARRDTDGYITIYNETKNWGAGMNNYCFSEDEIDNLARKLGVL
jgi:hypothetical protein